MKLIDPNEIPFVLTPIEPIRSGESRHYEHVAFQQEVDKIRRIEAEPVKHAHWIKGVFADITCSNCGFPLRVPDSMIPKLAYCPHCAAKMDEVEE